MSSVQCYEKDQLSHVRTFLEIDNTALEFFRVAHLAGGVGRSFDALPLALPFGDLDPLGLGLFDGAASACGCDGGAWAAPFAPAAAGSALSGLL